MATFDMFYKNFAQRKRKTGMFLWYPRLNAVSGFFQRFSFLIIENSHCSCFFLTREIVWRHIVWWKLGFVCLDLPVDRSIFYRSTDWLLSSFRMTSQFSGYSWIFYRWVFLNPLYSPPKGSILMYRSKLTSWSTVNLQCYTRSSDYSKPEMWSSYTTFWSFFMIVRSSWWHK